MPPSILFLLFGVNIIWVSLNNIFGFVNHVQDNSPYYSIRAPPRAEKLQNRKRSMIPMHEEGINITQYAQQEQDEEHNYPQQHKKPLVTIQIPVFKEVNSNTLFCLLLLHCS